jgi:hypothetical protein
VASVSGLPRPLTEIRADAEQVVAQDPRGNHLLLQLRAFARDALVLADLLEDAEAEREKQIALGDALRLANANLRGERDRLAAQVATLRDALEGWALDRTPGDDGERRLLDALARLDTGDPQ